MSFNSEDRRNDPNDPLYYAPRSGFSEANLRSYSTPPTRPVRPTSSPSRFDEMLDEAVTTRHPLDPEVVPEPDQPRALLVVASRFAAAIGVLAMVGVLLFILVPKSQGSNPPTPAGANKAPSEESQALLQKFIQFEKRSLTSAETAKVTPEESQSLLEKFVQWQQRQ
jgi:hypothetical protein